MPDSPNTLHCEASTPDPCLIPSHRRGLFLLHLNISRAPLPVRPVISTSGGQQSLSEPARHSTSTGLAGAVHQGHGTSFTHQNWVHTLCCTLGSLRRAQFSGARGGVSHDYGGDKTVLDSSAAAAGHGCSSPAGCRHGAGADGAGRRGGCGDPARRCGARTVSTRCWVKIPPLRWWRSRRGIRGKTSRSHWVVRGQGWRPPKVRERRRSCSPDVTS